jgi:hypothetical protein
MHFSSGREEKNEYCIYIDEVPDIALAYGDEKGLMGLHELPLKLVSEIDNTEVTKEELDAYIAHNEKFSNLFGKRGSIEQQIQDVMSEAQGLIKGKNPTDLSKDEMTRLSELQQLNGRLQKEMEDTFNEVQRVFQAMDEHKKVILALKPKAQIKSCVRGSISVPGSNSRDNCDVVALSTIIKELVKDDDVLIQQKKSVPLHFIVVHACTQGVQMPSKSYKLDNVDQAITEIVQRNVQGGGKRKKSNTTHKGASKKASKPSKPSKPVTKLAQKPRQKSASKPNPNPKTLAEPKQKTTGQAKPKSTRSKSKNA